MRNFRNLEIWKKAIELTKLIYKITDDFPATEKYALNLKFNGLLYLLCPILQKDHREGQK